MREIDRGGQPVEQSPYTSASSPLAIDPSSPQDTQLEVTSRVQQQPQGSSLVETRVVVDGEDHVAHLPAAAVRRGGCSVWLRACLEGVGIVTPPTDLNSRSEAIKVGASLCFS